MASYFEVMVGTSSCLAITDGDGTGLRICGGKQWGGATTKHKWEITESVAEDIINCLKNDFPSLFGNAQQQVQPDGADKPLAG